MKIKINSNYKFYGEPDPTGRLEGDIRWAQRYKTWQDVYRLFEAEIEKYDEPSDILKAVEKIYRRGKGLPQFEEAYFRWLDDDTCEDNDYRDMISCSKDDKVSHRDKKEAKKYSKQFEVLMTTLRQWQHNNALFTNLNTIPNNKDLENAIKDHLRKTGATKVRSSITSVSTFCNYFVILYRNIRSLGFNPTSSVKGITMIISNIVTKYEEMSNKWQESADMYNNQDVANKLYEYGNDFQRLADNLEETDEKYSDVSASTATSEYVNKIFASEDDADEYWYFTRHGVQPGSVPRYVNILDIKDVEDGSYFLADGVIRTEDLEKYEIEEKKPEKIYSFTSLAQEGYKGYLDSYETIRFEYNGPADVYEGREGMEMYLEDDNQFKPDNDDVYKDSEYNITFTNQEEVLDAVDQLIKERIPQIERKVNVHIIADLHFDIYNIHSKDVDLGYDWYEEERVYDTVYSGDDVYSEFDKDKSKLVEFEIR